MKLTLTDLINKSMAHPGRETRVFLKTPGFFQARVVLTALSERVERKGYGLVTKTTYRLMGERIPPNAAELLLRAYEEEQ